MKMTRVNMGFTLLEIMVAIFILSILAGSIFFFYERSSTAIHETSRQLELFDKATVAMQVVLEDIESTSLLINDIDGKKVIFPAVLLQKNMSGSMDADLLSLLAVSPPAGVREGMKGRVRVRFFCREIKGKLALFRLVDEISSAEDMLENNTPTDEEVRQADPVVTGLTGVRFVIEDDQGAAYEDWPTGALDDSEKKPRTVMVTLKFQEDKDTPPRSFTGRALLPPSTFP